MPNNKQAILALLADGEVLGRVSGALDGVVGGGGGAPTTADYLVKTADAGLSAERVVTDTATVSWDWGTAGQAKAQIPDGAVTYAKIQDVSATDKVLGRSTSGAGDIEEIACTAAGRALLDDADATAQRTTLGLGTAATHAHGEYEAAGAAAAAVSAHEAASDPHTGYQRESEKGNANGYASLGAGGLVPVAQLGSGAPDGTKFLRDDGTFQTPAGGSGLTHPQTMARVSMGV